MLAELYGSAANPIADRLDALVASARAIRAAGAGESLRDRWSERDAWIIVYPDQFGSRGLDGVRTVARALAPEINGVHVLPFHPSSSDGGFSVVDYAAVDPAAGSWSDVSALAGDTRLMVDAVVNHVSAQGVWFQAHLAGDRTFADFFRVVPEGTDLSAVVRPRPGRPTTAFVGADGSMADYWTTFSEDQVDLDYRSPEVLLAVCEAVLRYVEAGAAAVRLDAVAFLAKDPATSSMHLVNTHRIVALLRDCLDEVDPQVVLITETNVAHADNVSYLGTASRPEAHAVYQFSLAPLVLHAVQTGDADPLCRWIGATDMPADTTTLNFLASHDGVGVRPAAGWLSGAQIDGLAQRCVEAGGRVNEAATSDGVEPYELAATWRALCGVGAGGPFGDGDLAARMVAAHSVAFALAGVPLLYVHSLSGSDNATKRAEPSDAARDLNRARFASPGDYLAVLSDDPVARLVWPALRDMLGWRLDCVAFHPESAQQLLEAPPGVVAVRRGSATDAALVVTNLGSQPQTLSIGEGWRSCRNESPVADALELGPWAAIWLRNRPPPKGSVPVSAS